MHVDTKPRGGYSIAENQTTCYGAKFKAGCMFESQTFKGMASIKQWVIQVLRDHGWRYLSDFTQKKGVWLYSKKYHQGVKKSEDSKT